MMTLKNGYKDIRSKAIRFQHCQMVMTSCITIPEGRRSPKWKTSKLVESGCHTEWKKENKLNERKNLHGIDDRATQLLNLERFDSGHFSQLVLYSLFLFGSTVCLPHISHSPHPSHSSSYSSPPLSPILLSSLLGQY